MERTSVEKRLDQQKSIETLYRSNKKKGEKRKLSVLMEWKLVYFKNLGFQKVDSIVDERLNGFSGVQSLADDTIEVADHSIQMSLNHGENGFEDLDERIDSNERKANSNWTYVERNGQISNGSTSIIAGLEETNVGNIGFLNILKMMTNVGWLRLIHWSFPTYIADVLNDLKEDFEDVLIDLFHLSNERSQNLEEKNSESMIDTVRDRLNSYLIDVDIRQFVHSSFADTTKETIDCLTQLSLESLQSI